MLEKDIENLIAKYPEEFFPGEGFILKGQQIILSGRRFDLLFLDMYNRKIIIEIKKGILSREASGQIIEYYGLLKNSSSIIAVELILVANIIPIERRLFLETSGISCKEISEIRISEIAKKYNYKITEQVIFDNIEKTNKSKNQQSLKPKIKTIDDLYGQLKIADGKNIIDYIINKFSESKKYQCSVEQKKIFFSYSIHRIENDKLIYDYAFIVNKTNLLFYIRKPGEKWLLRQGKLDRIENELKIMRNNKIKEISIRIDSVEIAIKICDLLLN